jgi:HAAS
MSDVDPIDDYLREFAQQLPIRGRQANRVLHEINDHLRELADELCSQGMEPAAAATKAIERFGSPSEVRERFDLEAPLESEVDAMFRYVLMSVAALTFAFGAAFMIFSGFDDARPTMLITKLVASAIMMACSSVVFHQGWSVQPLANWQRAMVLASALLSIAIGSAGAVFTAHLGLVTRDWEMYGFVGAALLILQGTLATTHITIAQAPSQPRPA